MFRKFTTSVFLLIALVGTMLVFANVMAQPTINGGMVSGDQNTTVLVPITADNFESVNQFAFSMSWDNEGLKFLGVQDALAGVSIDVSDNSEPILAVNYNDVELTIPDGTVLFYANFRIVGAPGSSWSIELIFESIQVGGVPAVGALSNNGQVTVNVPPPIIRPQNTQGLPGAMIVVPITAENFENVNQFNISIGGLGGFVEVQDVYPGIVIIPPAPGFAVFSANYDSANLTLPDNTVLFNVVYQLFGLPGTNQNLNVNVSSMQVSGVALPIPVPQIGIIHIIDPSPITLHAQHVSANAGEEVVMPITVSNFTGVREINFTMSWDPSVVEYIEPDFVESHISYLDADGSEGILQGTFLSNPQVSLPNGATLVELRFLMKSESSGKPTFNILIGDTRISGANASYFDTQTVNGSFTQSYPTITADSVSGYQNTNVLVPITADHFTDVNQLEFSLDWDVAGLTLIDVQDVLPGMSVDIVDESTVTATISIDEGLNVNLPDGAVLFYLNFNITGNPGTSWPVNLVISSILEYDVAVNSISHNGEVDVSFQIPVFRPQRVEGSALSTVLVPITAENFNSIDAFEFNVTWMPSFLDFDFVQDVYPGLIVTPINNSTLSASYNGGTLTLPDSTVLFRIAFQVSAFAHPGTDHNVTVQPIAITAWGVALPIPSPQVAPVHVIDPDPITIIAHDVNGFAGFEVVMPITVSNFTEVRRVDFLLTWDPSAVEYLSPDVLEAHTDFLDADGSDGTLRGYFLSNPSTSLANGDTVLLLRFRLLNEFEGITPFTISIPATPPTRVHNGDVYSGVQTIAGSFSSELPVTFAIGKVMGERFSNVNVPIVVSNFQDVNGASFYVRWDSTEVELNDIHFELPTSFDSVNIENGIAFISFTFPVAQNLVDSTTLINLDFELIGNYGDASRISIDRYLPREVIINNVVFPDMAIFFGDVTINGLRISGYVRYPNSEGVYAGILATDSFVDVNGATNDEGYYEIRFSGPGPFLSVTPYRNDLEPFNGLDMGDVAAINAYVADPQASELTTAYQVIAADVDHDELVTETDADIIELALVGDIELPPSNSIWRFVAESHVFTDIHNPYPYPNHFEIADYNVVSPLGTQVDFVGIKPGDVNLSRDNSLGRVSASQTVTLEVNTRPLDNGITEVEVRALEFADVRAYQFTLSWDASAFELLDNNLFSMGRYSKVHAVGGHLPTVWNTPKAMEFVDGTTLITFMLQAKDYHSTAKVSVTDAITAIKVFDPTLSKLSVNVVEQLRSGEEDHLEVYPNPTVSKCFVVAYSNALQQSSVEVSDINGRSVLTQTTILQPGKNVLSIDTEKWAKGIYLLKLRTGTKTEIKKLVKK